MKASLGGLFLAGVATMCIGLVPSHVAAQSVSLDLANDYPATAVPSLIDQHFAKLVEEKSDGDMQIVLHLGGSLGLNSSQMLDAVGTGAVDMANAAVVFYGGDDSIFQISALPFFAGTPAEAEAISDAVYAAFEERLQPYNHKLLYIHSWTPTGLWAREPITTVEDLQGLSLRTFDPNAVTLFGELGANPQVLSWGDTASQVSAGALDGVLAADENTLAARIHEDLSYYIPINYTTGFNAVSMNLDVFESLSPEQQATIEEAARETQAEGWTILYDRFEKSEARLAEEGVTTVVPEPELMERLHSLAEPMIQAWVESGGDAAERIYEARQQPAN